MIELVRREGGVAYLRINRPEVLNALDAEHFAQIFKALDEVAKDQAVKVVILTGVGRAFCVGADLGELRKYYERGEKINHGDILRERYNKLVLKIRTLEKPVIAAINGVAAGAGIGIALMCDLRVASDQAKFILAFGRVGLVPDSGLTYLLPRLIGHGRVFQWYVDNNELSAAEAQRLGLVDIVYSHEDFEKRMEELAYKIANGPLKAYALLKRAINRFYLSELVEALEYEAFLQEVAGYTEDHYEGVMAFIQKRQPKFKGN
ncbi:MAG: enoyl-CoA hydratase/isomerase family protein [Pyrobaculum sp.]|jgi:2-(1,2-epoxy-1,2-dihydrophenyl)acetyl-CoA isomerase